MLDLSMYKIFHILRKIISVSDFYDKTFDKYSKEGKDTKLFIVWIMINEALVHLMYNVALMCAFD